MIMDSSETDRKETCYLQQIIDGCKNHDEFRTNGRKNEQVMEQEPHANWSGSSWCDFSFGNIDYGDFLWRKFD